MRQILITGGSGLVGSRIIELLENEYHFIDLSLEKGIDITRKESVEEIFAKYDKADWVFHLAAKTNVDECEKDKKLGEKSPTWVINVVGTENIAQACRKFSKKLLYVSTDFVFDGKKSFYKENDLPNPINFYAQTKYMGEKIIQKILNKFLICRIAFPYRSKFTQKLDLVRSIIDELSKKKPVLAVSDQIITPTFTDDIALAIDRLIKNNTGGIYHLVGSQPLSPLESAVLIAEFFGYNKKLITPVKARIYFKNRAVRPYFLALKNDKIKTLGAAMKTFDEGIKEVKRQLMFRE